MTQNTTYARSAVLLGNVAGQERRGAKIESVSDNAELVKAYWEQRRRANSDDRDTRRTADELWWAWEAVEDRVQEDPDNVVVLLVELADAAPDNDALAYLGAGPVENLLRDGDSQVMYDRVEGWARRNENFRKALGCAWFDDHVPAAVARRLRAVTSA